MIYYCGSCGGGTTVLVLCIGIEFRIHMTNSVVVVVVDIPLYCDYVLVLVLVFSGGGCGGSTTVLVLCICIESRLQMTYTIVVVVVVVPLYWYYVLVFSQEFT